ncbi:hypothetical protein CMI40_02255 [Candidatus Pacearchaeota archaeon]|jgi:hypothetical protein|nr:hypothetical protein [Candidatus Pacearchaeota archaeon]|tara:strand:- start:5717 stop:5989 length:273 start_codon:yes stop_codon:yes gene_type:complete
MGVMRQTTVSGLIGEVMISTISKGKNVFETMAFPIKEDGKIDFNTELAVKESYKRNDAKRTHRTICQELDNKGRKYMFSNRLMNYIPCLV